MLEKSLYKTEHLATLDGLRGVAALSVVAYHIVGGFAWGVDFPHAYLAVDFFFVLSGFVVANAYEAKLKTSLTFTRFVAIRLVRLYPMIFIGVVLGAIIFGGRIFTTHDLTVDHFLIATLSAFLLLPTTVALDIHPTALYPVNGPHWSLFFEIVINFVYAPLVRWLNTGRLVVICVLSSLALCYVAAVSGHGLFIGGGPMPVGFIPVDFYCGFIRVTFPFSVGVLLYRFRPKWRASNLLSAMLMLLLIMILFAQVFPKDWQYDMIAVVLLFPPIVYCGAACRNGAAMNALCLALGELSYPLYVTHVPMLRLVRNAIQILHIPMPPIVIFGLSAALSIAAAFVLIKIWDLPVRKWLSGRLLKRA